MDIMYLKIEISGNILVKTGLHIGNPDGFSAIGTADSTVIRDALTGLPMLPGSSLKGKMRSLLARSLQEKPVVSGDRNDDPERILTLFGSSGNQVKNIAGRKGRLQFSDSILSNEKEILARGASQPTEVKYENTIHPLTAVANPRQIERVISGSVFPLSLIYEFAYTVPAVPEEILDPFSMIDDFELIGRGFQLLEMDYLGGHGSRGYGRISLEDLSLRVVFPSQMPEDIGEIIQESEDKLLAWKTTQKPC